jgi:hypothetical protein
LAFSIAFIRYDWVVFKKAALPETTEPELSGEEVPTLVLALKENKPPDFLSGGPGAEEGVAGKIKRMRTMDGRGHFH